MRRKLFNRNLPPEIILRGENLYDWIDKLKPDDSICNLRWDRETNTIYLDIEGNVVFENFINKFSSYEIRVGKVTGKVTKLYELNRFEIYVRIKDYYIELLDKCMGMSDEFKEKYLFGERSKIFSRILFNDNIEKSSEYIKNLPADPSEEQLLNLTHQIFTGILEYAFHAKDKNGVTMKEYAYNTPQNSDHWLS